MMRPIDRTLRVTAIALALLSAPALLFAAEADTQPKLDGAALPARLQAASADLFAPHDWQPPPPPPRVVKVEAPKAPPLPFTYFGKVIQDGAVIAFVSQGNVDHALKTGDTVANYRVQQITASAMTFVYLPLNEKQTLPFGSEN